MSFEVKIIADHLNVVGNRITTFELTFPRIILGEFNTHRMFSRNACSSRAIPVEVMIKRVKEDPFIPVHWGKNQKGMVAEKEFDIVEQGDLTSKWLEARDNTLWQVETLKDLGVHKQIVNRLLEPWMWTTVVCTATNYSNFFYLRCTPDAEPHMKKLAYMMSEAYDNSYPLTYLPGGWHLPYITKDESSNLPLTTKIAISVARCARVSLWHQGEVRTIEEDIKRYEECVEFKHWSPLEHQAESLSVEYQSGNFTGWKQLRKTFKEEYR